MKGIKNMNKTNRKNKTKLSVNWPKNSIFTFKELHTQNSQFDKEITLRVRLTKAINEGTVVELGTKNLGKGRPLAVYSMTPVSDKLVETAKNDGVVLHESATVKVADIKSNKADVVTTKVENSLQTA